MHRIECASILLDKSFGPCLYEALTVNQIIFILESEKVVEPGKLTRPTLQRYLYRAGFGKKQMKK